MPARVAASAYGGKELSGLIYMKRHPALSAGAAHVTHSCWTEPSGSARHQDLIPFNKSLKPQQG
jgi:hypothetical protein